MSDQKYLSTKEAAEYIGLSNRTLEKARVIGGGPAYLKLGRRVVYAVCDLEGWLMDRRRRMTSETQ